MWHIFLFIVISISSSQFLNAQWVKEVKNKQMLRFQYPEIRQFLNHAQENMPLEYKKKKKKYKFLVTDDTQLELHGFKRIASVRDLDKEVIAKSVFVVFFHTDDDYIDTLRRITEAGGVYYSLHSTHPKVHYTWVDKHALQAIDKAFSFGDLISHQNVDVHETLCMCLQTTKDLPGDYVEIGVYKGGSALTALIYMDMIGMHRKSYFLDTFNGMTYEEAYASPDSVWQGTHVLWGVEKTMEHVARLLRITNQNFELIESNICRNALPNSIKKIVVCNLDVDVYDATLHALIKVAPLMVKGGIIICEDPTSTPQLGGALLAMHQFLETSMGKKFIKILLPRAQYLLIKLED